MRKIKTKQIEDLNSGVTLEADLIVTSKVGAITDFDAGKQYKTIAADVDNGDGTTRKKTLNEVLGELLTKRVLPTVTAPAVTVTSTQMKAYEVGTKVTVTATVTLSAGSYSYGPATGVVAESVTATLGGDSVEATPSGNSAQVTFEPIVVKDDTDERVEAVVAHTEGRAPVDNLETEHAELAIAAGEKSGHSGRLTGYRQWFYGAVKGFEATSEVIRALAGKSGAAYTTGKTVTVRADSVHGAEAIVVAVPTKQIAGARTGLKSVFQTNGLRTDVTAAFECVGTNIQVEGANGAGAVDYTVWVHQPAALTSTNVYEITLA